MSSHFLKGHEDVLTSSRKSKISWSSRLSPTLSFSSSSSLSPSFSSSGRPLLRLGANLDMKSITLSTAGSRLNTTMAYFMQWQKSDQKALNSVCKKVIYNGSFKRIYRSTTCIKLVAVPGVIFTWFVLGWMLFN